MPLTHRELLEVCEIISSQEQLKVAVRGALKGAAFTGLTALIGGLVAGPVGLAVGSAAGGVVSAMGNRGKYKSVIYVIMYEMTDKEKRSLTNAVKNALRGIDASDIATVLTVLASNHILKSQVINVIKKAVSQNLGL
ncbi:hypothetical protein BDFB_012545 [Asbolus verrucosus]|uniref:Uncharacterized protein n=1 Tax=Asbolus verrucosus TaxID=1661398 RepID=A0A482W4M9_ASBVE|nr:hypothetical protein BDFB_012545 [Asbolus verrucosus]